MAAVQAKLSIKRNQKAQDIVVAAGATIAGSDALFVNIDQTAMSKVEVLLALDMVKQKIHEHGWPIDGTVG